MFLLFFYVDVCIVDIEKIVLNNINKVNNVGMTVII